LSGIHQLLVCADDVNIVGDNINTSKKNTQTLIDPSKKIGLEVNTEITKYTSCLVTKIQGKIIT
jgi:ABC-type antimicrobial peptide transport system ATPase subunit